jgi:hypothetical protein
MSACRLHFSSACEQPIFERCENVLNILTELLAGRAVLDVAALVCRAIGIE